MTKKANKATPKKVKMTNNLHVNFTFKEEEVDEFTAAAILSSLNDAFGEVTYFNYSVSGGGGKF